MTRISLLALVVVSLVISACGASAPAATIDPSGTPPLNTMPATPAAASAPSAPPSEAACQGIGRFEPLRAGDACWIDIGTDDETSIRVTYTIPAPGWVAFVGTYKDVGAGPQSERVGVLIADVKNVTVHACDQQWGTAPPVGPAVEDLAAALTNLPPFEVTLAPADVDAFGYSGTRLQIRVRLDQAFNEESRTFSGCTNGDLASWMSPPLNPAFYGYVAPGDTEDFWILDVEGTRVVIASLATANASDQLLAERQEVLDSIVIEPSPIGTP